MPRELSTQKIPLSAFEPRGDTLYTWLGMAGVLVNAGGTVLLVDPLITLANRQDPQLSEAGFHLKVPLPIEAHEVPRAAAVLYTHADEDHFGKLTARVLAERLACNFIAPPPVAQGLAALGVPQEKIVTARDFDSIPIGEVVVSITPALHDWQAQDPWKRGDCCGYLIKTPDGTLWHPGDTRLIDPLEEIRGVEVLFFDVAAVDAHLGPVGSAKLARSSGAKVLVAYHYGTFDLPPGTFGSCDPEDSRPHLAGIPAVYLQPDPGELLRLPLKV